MKAEWTSWNGMNPLVPPSLAFTAINSIQRVELIGWVNCSESGSLRSFVIQSFVLSVPFTERKSNELISWHHSLRGLSSPPSPCVHFISLHCVNEWVKGVGWIAFIPLPSPPSPRSLGSVNVHTAFNDFITVGLYISWLILANYCYNITAAFSQFIQT